MISYMVVALLSQAPMPEVFVDRGETYVRMGVQQGLIKGVTVDIVDAQSSRLLGTAVVMEVWEGLARVNLDSGSTQFKGLKYARLRGAAPLPVAAPPPPQQAPPQPQAAVAPPPPPQAALAPPPPSSQAPVAVAVPVPVPVAPQGRTLKGKVQVSGGWAEARRFIIANDDEFDWHHCKIRLPDGRGYDKMSELRAGSDEGIMLFRFEPNMALRDASGLVTVACVEGAARFSPQF